MALITYQDKQTAVNAASPASNEIFTAADANQIKTVVNDNATDVFITGKLLTGLTVTGSAVVATDSILTALGKVQNQINSKQGTISLTTTGTSNASTLIGNVLNIPTYSLAGLGGVPTSRQLTINGTTFDLSVDRSWSVGTVTSVAAITLGTTGTDLSSTVSNSTTTPLITLNVPTASATNRGALSSTDWSIFNNKQAALNGTGFVKISGTTISYDNSTYLTTSSASTTYLPLAGGTLTGTLNGTNAVFSTGITSQDSFIGTRDKLQSFFAGYAVGINVSSGVSNTFSGYSSGTLLTSGSSNTFYGTFSGASATTGNSNTLIGNSAGVAITTGSGNTFFGSDAGSGITTGSGNTIIGLAGVLSSALTNNIILASGAGIKAKHDGTNWTFTGGTILTGALSGTTSTFTGTTQSGVVKGIATSGFGVSGESTSGNAVTGNATTGTGGSFIANGTGGVGLIADSYTGTIARFQAGGSDRVTISNTGLISGTSATFSSLSGTGDRIVVTNSSGLVSSAVIGSGLSYSGGILTATGGGGGGGTGTVTSVSALTLGTTGTDLSSSVVNSTTTPVITLNVPTASATNRGVLSSTDWTTFNSKLSSAITTLNTLTSANQTFAVGTSGTDFAISSAISTHTFNLPTASATNRGALSSTDWSTFNGKQAALNGTGFVKISGTTISYDNSIYLTTSSASSTYLPLTGGTLTGTLNGTSATFSGNVNLTTDASTVNTTFGGVTTTYFYTNANGGNIAVDGVNTISFRSGGVNGTRNMIITGAGNVGIGTTTDAGYKLDVNGSGRFVGTLTGASSIFTNVRVNASGEGIAIVGATGNPAYLAIDQSVNNASKRWRVGHTGAIGGYSSFDIYNQTDNITALTLASTGAATLSNLAGTGTRMVVSDSTGLLSTQAIPSGGGGSVDELQVALLSQVFG